VTLLGVGNWLMGDEGVGVHAAHALENLSWPEGIRVVDGGTGGFHLMGYLEEAAHVILLDATLDGRPPGTIRLLRPRFASDFPKAMSSHDIGLRDLIEGLAILGRLPDIWLFAMSIASVQPQTIELSPAISAIMPDLVSQARTLALDLTQGDIPRDETRHQPSADGRPYAHYRTTVTQEPSVTPDL
jgi:hydrogenase maturation protease